MPRAQPIPATVYYSGGEEVHVHDGDGRWIATCTVRERDGGDGQFAAPAPGDDAIRFRVGQCLALDQLPRVEIAHVSPERWLELGSGAQ
jgi:hypothetical protein